MKLFLNILCLLIGLQAYAQHDHRYCGTPDIKSAWLTEYQKNPDAYSHMRSSNDTLYIALTVHNVGSDINNLFPITSVFNALCKLNNDFKPYKILFYLKRPVRNIINSTWNDHTFQQGNNMMLQNNFNDSANCYIVSNPAGTCGYFSHGGGAVALSKSCLGGNNTTWTHELGHFFSLPHTFVGWEGEEYDPSKPTPTSVGNRVVELVDRSNCHFAADGFCDTEPDYLSDRWTCNGDGESNVIQTDPKGETFKSDGTLFMSYSNDACTTRFSEEQVDAMRANMLSQNIRMTATVQPYESFQTSLDVSFITPNETEVNSGEELIIEWEPVDQAYGYQVQVSRNSTFTFPDLFTTTEAPEIAINFGSNKPNTTYYVRARAFIPHNFCTEFSEPMTFNKMPSTSVVDNEFNNSMNIFPNPIQLDGTLNINDVPENLDYQIVSNTGQILQTGNLNFGNNKIALNSALPAGFLVLRVFNEDKHAIFKVLVQ